MARMSETTVVLVLLIFISSAIFLPREVGIRDSLAISDEPAAKTTQGNPLQDEYKEVLETWSQPGYQPEVDPRLSSWLAGNELSDEVVVYGGVPKALIFGAPWMDVEDVKECVQVDWYVDLQGFKVVRVALSSTTALENLLMIDGVTFVNADEIHNTPDDDLDRTVDSQAYTGGAEPDMFEIRNKIGVTGSIASNYTGDGVIVGHLDTGCDFGNPDLRHAYHPGSFDPTGYGLTLTWYHANSTPVDAALWTANPFNLLTYEDAGGDIYLNVTGWDPLLNNLGAAHYLIGDGGPSYPYDLRVGFVWLYAYYWGIDVDDMVDLIWHDWKLPDPSNVHGNYSVGWVFQQRNNPYAKLFAPSLVYEGTDNENHLIVNWDDTMGWNKFWTGGFYYETYNLTDPIDKTEIVNEFDWDFTDEFTDGEIFGLDEPVVSHDYTNDSIDDFSLGALCWCYDDSRYFDDDILFNEYLFNGFRSDRDAFALYFDESSHGTSTASHIVSSGNHTYYNYDNATHFTLRGVAPDAKLISVRTLTSGSTFGGYLWACGFDRYHLSGEYYYTGNHQADVITNSWGFASAPSKQFHYESFTWEILSTPGFLNPSYPGVLHIFSAGNEGPGFMTVGPPGCAAAVLTVGASTSNHWLDYKYGPGQDVECIASFSSKGPSFSGYPKPDVLAPGLAGYAAIPSYAPLMASSWQPSWTTDGFDWKNYTLFSGTSQSAPVATGVAALVVEALGGGVSNPAEVKVILQSTADDLGYDPATQGFGRINAEKACDFATNGTGMIVSSQDSSSNFASIVSDAWEYSGVFHQSTLGLTIDPLAESFPDRNQDGAVFFGQVMASGTSMFQLSLFDNASDMFDTPMAWGAGWSASATHMKSAAVLTFSGTTYSYNDTVVPGEQMYGWFNLSDELDAFYDAAIVSCPYMTVSVSFDAFEVAEAELWMFLYDWEDTNLDEMPNLWNSTSGVGDELTRLASAVDPSNAIMMSFAVSPGNIGDHLDGSIVLVIHDPIHDSDWSAPGNDFICTVIFWESVVSPLLSFDAGGTGNTINVTLSLPADAEVGIHQGYMMFSDGIQNVSVPYSYSVVANLTGAEGEAHVVVSGYGAELSPYDNPVYGCMEEDPDNWEFRSFAIYVPRSNASLLGVRVIWSDVGHNMSVAVLNSRGLELSFGSGGTAYTTAVIAEINGKGTYYVLVHPIALNGSGPLPANYTMVFMWYSQPSLSDVILSYTANDLATPVVMAQGSTVIEDTAIGDHVVLNVSFPDFNLMNMPEFEVTDITMSFFTGIYFRQSTPLVIPDASYNPFSGTIQLDQFAWMVVDGIREGDYVDIEVDFTNGDCDIMVWWNDVDNTTWTYVNNLVGGVMSTGAHPEVGSFTADRDGEIAVGCFDYDLSAGTWTLTVDTRVGLDIPAVGPEVTFDTYWFHENITLQLQISAATGTNFDLEVSYPYLTFCNFFAPRLHTINVAVNGSVADIYWTQSDRNRDDELFFDVLISADSGYTYQLLASRLTSSYFSWNAAGFLARNYKIKVRVFDNDPDVNPDAAATGIYWMGLRDEIESSEIYIDSGYTEDLQPNISHPLNLMYVEGDTGNWIVWTLNGTNPYTFEVTKDDELVKFGYWNTTGETVRVCVDGLSPGIYRFDLTATNTFGRSTIDSVRVTVSNYSGVLPPGGPGTGFDILGTIGAVVTGASITVIVIFSALICQDRRKR